MISYINKVTRPVMMLTGRNPLVRDSHGLVSSNKSCSSTLYFSEPHSNILLLSQTLLMSCSGAGRRHLLGTRVGTDLSYCRFPHVAATDKRSNNCSSSEIRTAQIPVRSGGSDPAGCCLRSGPQSVPRVPAGVRREPVRDAVPPENTSVTLGY